MTKKEERKKERKYVLKEIKLVEKEKKNEKIRR